MRIHTQSHTSTPNHTTTGDLPREARSVGELLGRGVWHLEYHAVPLPQHRQQGVERADGIAGMYEGVFFASFIALLCVMLLASVLTDETVEQQGF